MTHCDMSPGAVPDDRRPIRDDAQEIIFLFGSFCTQFYTGAESGTARADDGALAGNRRKTGVSGKRVGAFHWPGDEQEDRYAAIFFKR